MISLFKEVYISVVITEVFRQNDFIRIQYGASCSDSLDIVQCHVTNVFLYTEYSKFYINKMEVDEDGFWKVSNKLLQGNN